MLQITGSLVSSVSSKLRVRIFAEVRYGENILPAIQQIISICYPHSQRRHAGEFLLLVEWIASLVMRGLVGQNS